MNFLWLWLEPVFATGQWLIGSYLVVQEDAYFQTSATSTPGIYMVFSSFWTQLLKFIKKHSNLIDLNMDNLVAILWIWQILSKSHPTISKSE
jgi:hypothetical protein